MGRDFYDVVGAVWLAGYAGGPLGVPFAAFFDGVGDCGIGLGCGEVLGDTAVIGRMAAGPDNRAGHRLGFSGVDDSGSHHPAAILRFVLLAGVWQRPGPARAVLAGDDCPHAYLFPHGTAHPHAAAVAAGGSYGRSGWHGRV